jgi:hypothetical protein
MPTLVPPEPAGTLPAQPSDHVTSDKVGAWKIFR